MPLNAFLISKIFSFGKVIKRNIFGRLAFQAGTNLAVLLHAARVVELGLTVRTPEGRRQLQVLDVDVVLEEPSFGKGFRAQVTGMISDLEI